jgi:hypothetical protein
MTFYRLEYKNINFICIATVCCPLSMSFYHCYNLRKINEPNNKYYMQQKELLNWINEEDNMYIVNGEQNKTVKHQRINRSL